MLLSALVLVSLAGYLAVKGSAPGLVPARVSKGNPRT